jgi:hypothetical protein
MSLNFIIISSNLNYYYNFYFLHAFLIDNLQKYTDQNN